MTIYDLKINGIREPLGFELPYVSVSWKVRDTASVKAVKTALTIARDAAFNDVIIKKEDKTLRSTGEVLDIELQPRTRYYVRVELSGDKGDAACAESADIEADVRLSARTRDGLDALISLLRARVGAEALDESLLTNERHIRCAREAADLIRASAEALDQGAPCDVAAVDLWEARRLLGEITGEDATEAVIDAVFASFCVGK